MTTNNAHTPKSANTQPTTRKTPLWRIWVIGLFVFIIFIILFFAWLVGTNSGLRFALFQLPKLANTQITADNLSGSLINGFSARRLRINAPSSATEISQIQFAWQAKTLRQKHLHIKQIALGDTQIKSKNAQKKASKPFSLPEHLNLPLSVAIDKIKIGRIQLLAQNDQEPTTFIDHIQAAFHYDRQQHHLQLHALQNNWSKSSGDITLNSNQPFLLRGNINSTGTLDNIDINNQLTLSGSLKSIQINNLLTGKGIGLEANTQIHPFESLLHKKIGHIILTGEHINPQAFHPKWPQASLTFNINAQPIQNDGTQLSGSIDLINDKAKWFNQNGIAIKTIQGQFNIDSQNIIHLLPTNIALLQKGKITTSGKIDLNQQTLDISAQIKQLTTQDFINQHIIGELNGNIIAKNRITEPEISWQLNTGRADISGSLNILSNAQKEQRTLVLSNGKILPKNGGELLLSGSYELFDHQKVQAKISSKKFNPAQLYPDFPEGSVNGEIDLNAFIAQEYYRANMQFAPSELSGAPLSGSGKITYENGHLSQADNNIILGKNTIQSKGAFGKKGDTLQLNINAPELNRFGFGITGSLNAKGNITSLDNSFTQLDAKLSGSAHQFSFNKIVKIQELNFNLLASPNKNRPLNIEAKGNSIQFSGSTIDTLDAHLTGTLQQHTLRAISSLKIDNKPLNINAQAQGGLNDQQQWRGNINALNLAGAIDLKLLAPFALEASAQRVALQASQWQALLGKLVLSHLTWDKENGLSTKGQAENLHLAQLHNFYQPPIEHNLVLSGDWDVRYNQNPTGYIHLRQQSGDIILPDERKSNLLLNQLTLNTQLTPNNISNQLSGQTRYGKVVGQINITPNFGHAFGQAPLSGQININSENLDTLRNFLPIGQTLSGQLQGNILLSGQLNQPQFSGSITGEHLNYRHREIGVVLTDGTLQSHLEGQKWIVDALTFKRKNGTVTLTGQAAYPNGKPDIQASILFHAYPILDQVNRYLAVSGKSDISYTQNGMFLSGSLKTDEARFGFQDSSAPSLGDDVVVVGEEHTTKTQTFPFHLNLDFDLNDQFLFSGQGLNVALGGKLNVQAKPNTPFSATGSVNVIKGRYKAYGQDLIIKKGIISFVGPLTNPNLNIRAERRASQVQAGVEVLGNLEHPRVNLVANEPMSEKDKLSWLILNRASSGSDTDEAALSTAAGALLAGSINDKIGLVDDFGLTSQQTRNKHTGEMNPAQQVLTFGKQLTRDLYLGYEAGLETASQSVKLMYQLSRSFQAILRAGTESSGGEIKYIKRFD